MQNSIDKHAVMIAVVLMVFASGCARPPEADKRVVAKINNYEMTVSDFQEEARLARGNKSLSPDKAKAQLLDGLISRKALVQEALKLNFDKDRTFMQEIERYWEQALLKLLFKNKSEELSRTVRVDDLGVRQAFAKMRKKIFAQFVVLSDKSAARQLSQAASNFDDLKNSFQGFITQETTEWWGWGDLPADIEDILFSLKPEEVSAAFEYSGNWAVVRVLKEEAVETAPFEKMAPYIRDELLRQKKTKALDNWIDSVTKKAKVKINRDILDGIKIE